MSFSLQDFLTKVQQGNPIKIKATDIDGYGIQISNVNIGGVEVEIKSKEYYDLGKFHTAKMILDSYPLRQLIESGTIEAEDGIINLSKEPVA